MNPQSSRPSAALGPVPAAPKPAPNPITTNMPQLGTAPGLADSGGVPTLPPVSPGTTQPLAPAPSPAPAPAPASAMPEYMNSASTSMIPVVDKPLDVNKVPDTPAEQFNPFASMPSPAPEPPKKSSKRTLNLILGLLTLLFAVAAVIFFVLWQQAANSQRVIPMPTDPTPEQSTGEPSSPADPDQPENPDQPAPVVRHLSCRGNEEIDETDAAAGLVNGSSIYDVYYPNGDDAPTEVRITSIAEYNSPETAAAVFSEATSETIAALSGIFGAFGINLSTDNFSLDGSTMTGSFGVAIDALTNPDGDLFSRQMLAGTIGFPFEYGEDGTTFSVHTDLGSVRASYEASGLVCEVVE